MSSTVPEARGAVRLEYVFARAMVWRSECATVVERRAALIEEQTSLSTPRQRERMAELRAELHELIDLSDVGERASAESSVEPPAAEGQGGPNAVVGADGLTAAERRAWRVEQVAEAALMCVGLWVDDDPNASRNDGLWLSSYWLLTSSEERAAAVAAIGALGALFEGFVIIAERPEHLRIGAMQVFTFGEVAPRRFAPVEPDAPAQR